MTFSPKDRAFYQLVARAAYHNPFSDERDSLDRAIVSATVGDDDSLIDELTETLEARVGPLRLTQLKGEDRSIAQGALLFFAFHRYADALDALIDAQAVAPHPVSVPFASEFTADLTARGFPKDRVPRVLELFYQMRRAWRFIHELTGTSRATRRLRERLWSAVMTNDIARYEGHLWNRMEDFSTILVGETGTGKGAAARSIGWSGFIGYDAKAKAFTARYQDLLVPLNLSEHPDALLESALFGHVKGAFTGAVQKREGALARCTAHGTVFLDEIGEVSVPAQVKLLRVLQEREFTPVGSDKPARFEGRVIAATHRSLDELRALGRFRDDFYFRLSSTVIHVPPLRDRLAEEPLELRQLIKTIVSRLLGEEALDDGALTADIVAAIEPFAFQHDWPGNVRELEQCVRRVLLEGSCPAPRKKHAHDGLASAFREGAMTSAELLARYCAHLYQKHRSYEQVGKITGLDRRTVKKHVTAAAQIER